MSHRIENMSRRVWTVFFLVFIAAPALVQITGRDPDLGPSGEKRKPSPWPGRPRAIAEVRAWPAAVDAWYKDHFGLRRVLIRGHSLLLYRGLRTTPQPRVIVGREDWLFYNGAASGDGDPVSDCRGVNPIPTDQMERWRWMLQDLHDWLAARNIPLLVALVPGKETIYPEYLPAWMTRVGPETTMEYAARYLTERGAFPFLNLLPVLQQARADHLAYLKTDTHWNEFGAYRAYRALAAHFAPTVPALEPWPESEFDRKDLVSPGGDLAGMMDLKPLLRDHFVAMHAHRPRRATSNALSDAEVADVESQSPDASLPRALFLRDSFTVGLIPYFAEHFSYAYYQWISGGVDLRVLDRVNPDLVVFIVGDRQLRLPMRYPTSMQTWACRQRFDASRRVLARFGADSGFDPLAPEAGLELRPVAEGLAAEARIPNPALTFPAPDGRDQLPLVRMDLTVPHRCDVSLLWTTSRRGEQSYSRDRRVTAPLQPGRNDLCLPLLDPDTEGRVRLEISGKTARFTIHSVEIRSVSRGAPAAEVTAGR